MVKYLQYIFIFCNYFNKEYSEAISNDFNYCVCVYIHIYWGVDKFLARPGRKGAYVSVRMAWVTIYIYIYIFI